MPSDPTPPCALDASDGRKLAAALGDTPETVIAVHLLHRGLAHAYVTGQPERFDAAIVQNLAFAPGELTGFGTAHPVWQLLTALHGWSSIVVDSAVAGDLGQLLAAETGHSVSFLDDIYHVLRQSVTPVHADSVRLLTLADAELLQRAPSELRGEGWHSTEALLQEGVAAAAVIDGEVVALAHTSARTSRHANLSVATQPGWRGHGLATAAAAMVVRQVQVAGQTPVWSAGATNAASLRIARKLGFVEVARRTYLIPSPAP